jgi:predicted acyltransferase (DUF342 family)
MSVSEFISDVSINGGLSVASDTSLNGSLFVGDGGTIAGLTSFTGIVTYDNFMISNATNQMNGSTTYNGNTTFAGKLTANEMTINEAFIAKKDAIYQSNMQVSNDLNVIARSFLKKDVEVIQGNVTIGKNLVTSGNAVINGDLSLNGKLSAGEVDVTFGPNSIPQNAVIDRNDFSNDASGLIISKMGLDNSVVPKVTIDLSGATDAIKLPRGTTAERPDLSNNDQGYIRYNAETSQFEGYGAGGAWGSLGGVTDVDQDTYVSAETAAGDDNDELKFYTAGSERMVIDACGNIGIKNSTPTVTLDLSGASDAVKLPIGSTAHRPDTSGNDGLGYIRYNTETSQFEGYGAGNTWGSLGGVTDVDQDTKIVAEVSAGADNDALQFITAGSERLTITSEGDLSLNKSIVLNKKLPIGMSEASFVTVTPTKASLAAASWSTTTNGVDVNWDVTSSSNLTTSEESYQSYYVFDASFGNTLDTSTLSTDSSGNFVDASGVIVRDASGNSLDASGNVTANTTELGYLTNQSNYDNVTGLYTGTTKTEIGIIGDISGEYIEITSDVSFNISAFHFKAVDYNGFLGAHLLPKKFTLAGYDDNSTTYKPIMRVTHSGAPTDNSFNAVTDEYIKFTTTDVSANDLGIGNKPRDVEYYSTSSGLYKKYRLIIEEKSNTTSDYTDVINRTFAGIGEWVITGTSPDPSTIVFTYEDSSANITMDPVDKDTLNINGNVEISENLSVGGVITVGGKIFLEDTVLSGDISLNDTLIVGGEIQVDHGLIVQGDASLNAGLVVSDDVSMNSGLSVESDASFNNGLYVGGKLSLNGPVSLGSTLSVVDDVSFNKGLVVAGDVSLNNKLFLNDASGVVFNTSILPETDNTISLGSANNRFKELHVKETVIGTDTLNFFSAAAGKVVGSLSFNTTKNVLDLSANGQVGESALLYNSKLSVGKYDNSSPQHELDVSGSALITGAAALSSTLDVSGATVLDNTVNVTGAATLENTLDVSGAAALASTLDVSGATVLDSTVNVTGAATLENTLDVTGAATLENTLDVTGASTLGGSLTVNGETIINHNLFLKSGATNKIAMTNANGNLKNSGYLWSDSQLVAGPDSKFVVSGTSGDITVNNGTSDTFTVKGSDGDTAIAGTLDVSGATVLDSTLDVSGDTKINTNKFVVTAASGNTDIAGTLDTAGATTLGSTLDVTGESTFNNNVLVKQGATTKASIALSSGNITTEGNVSADGSLYVNTDRFVVNGTNGNTDIAGTLDVAGATALANTLDVTGATTLTSTLDVTGESTFNNNVLVKQGATTKASIALSSGNITTEGNVSADGSLYVNTDRFVVNGTNGNTDIAGTLDVAAATTLASTLDVTGATTLNDDVSIINGKTFTVGDGASSMGGSLTVTGTTTLNDNVSITDGKTFTVGDGASSMGGTLAVSDAATLSSTLDVTGATTMAGPLDLNSTADINDTLTLSKSAGVGLDVASDATIGGDLDVTGVTTLSDTLDVSGDTKINTDKFVVKAASGNTAIAGTLDVSDNVVVDGTMKIGGVTTIGGSIIPDQDNVYSLGSGAFRFKEINVTTNTMNTDTLNFFSSSAGKVVGSLSFDTSKNVLDLSANGKVGESALLYNSKLAVGNADNSSPSVEMDVTGDAAVSNRLTVGGDVSMNNDVSIEGTLNVKGAVKLTEYSNEYITNIDTTNYTLIVSEDLSLNGRMYVHDDASFNKNVFIKDSLGIGIGEPVVSLDVSAVDAIKLPKGTTNERPNTAVNPAEHKGYIRYNSSTDQFEGYGAGNAWGSLGGVIDVDQDTKITAETSANADNDELRFYTADVERMRVKDNGDVSMNHDLSLQGAAALASTLDVTGATTMASTLDVSGDTKINTNKFVVTAASGNTAIAGTLDVSGATVLDSTVNVTGGAALASTLDVSGDTKINTNKFVVTAASGNTDIAGTLDVAGASTLTSTLDVTGATTLGSTLDVTGESTFNNNVLVKQGDTTKASIALSSGNISTQGNVSADGSLYVNTDKFVVNGTNGDTTVAGELNVADDTKINTDKFVVTAATGNTDIAGTLDAAGATTLGSTLDVTGESTFNNNVLVKQGDTTKASIALSSGNISTQGNVSANGSLYVNTDKFVVNGTQGDTTIAGELNVADDTKINTDKFVVTAASGNTDIAGTLDVAGATTLASTLDVTGATVLSDTLNVTGQTTFDNDVSLNARMDVGGDISFNSSVTITGGLTVDGAVKLTEINNEYVTNINTTNYDLIITEDLSLNGVLTVADDVSFNGGLFVKETAILGGDLSLNSNLYVNGDVSLNAGLKIQGSVELGGDMSFNSGISVQNDSSFNGNLNVNGITIGRALNDDNTTTVVGNDAASNLSGVDDNGNALGIHNTAIGFQSLKANYSEAYNTSVGSETLKSHNGGGTGKNTAVGASALGQTTTGALNIALGYQAGYDNKLGSQNIFIGNSAGVDDANGAMSGVVSIGNGAKATKDNQTFIENDEVYFNVTNDISGTAAKLHVGMINFLPEGITGSIPQSAISGLDSQTQTTTGDHIIEGRAFVGAVGSTGTSIINHNLNIGKTLTVTEQINGSAGMEIEGDASFNSNVSMAGVNNMLSFKTFEPVEVAGAISTTTSRDDPNYTGYVAVGDRLPVKTNIQFIKASTDGQHVMAYSTDAAGSIMISNDYGITYSSKSIEALDNSTYKVNRRAAMSLTGQYMVIVGNAATGGDGYIYHSSDFGATFTSSLSTSALTYTCVAMSGNGKNVFVGTNVEKLYTSTDFGASMNPHEASPISTSGISGLGSTTAGPMHNWRHVITNNTGKNTIAFTDSAVFISNDDENYDNGEGWHAPDVENDLGFGNETSRNHITDLESAFMTDDGAFAFIATAANRPYRINNSAHFNVTSLPSGGTNRWIDNNNWIYESGIVINDNSRWFMAATTNAGMDGKFLHVINTVQSDEVMSSYDGLNSTTTSVNRSADPNDDTPKIYKALAISGNGAYTYAADANELYVKQFNDGTTVQVETGEAFVLSKDMSLNERVFVNGDVIARSGFEVTSDVSFNSNLFVGGDVSMNSKLFVDGDVSMNSNLFLDGDASMNSSLFVGGDVSMNSKLFLDGDASMNSNLSVDGDASMNSSLFVGGDVSMDQKLAVKDSLVSDATLEHYKTGTTTFNVAVGDKADYGHRYSDGSSLGYLINGEMSPYINMMIGKTYTFVFENGYGSHPFKFYLDAEKSDPYTYNVTDNDSDTVSITVTSETPQILYYQCSAHEYMGNQIQVIGSKNFTGDSSFNAIKLPRGSTNERPEDGPEGEAQGYIRYNTETSQFEGFGAGNAWGSLGGIIDVDGDTFIKAETAANDDNDQLQFFTTGENRMTITSTGDVSMNQKLILDGDASFNSNLSVNGTLNVTGAVNLTEYNNEYITNIDTTNYTLIVTEDLSLNGNMKVNGTAQIDGEVTLNDNVSIADAKTLTVGTGASSLGGSLTVTGETTLNDNVSVTDGKTLTVGNGATTLGGTLGVTGVSTFSDNVSVADGKTLTVGNGATTIGGTLGVTGASTFSDNVSVTDGKTLTVGTGASSLGGSLTVDGITTLNENVSVADSKTLTVGTGASSLGGTLDVEGDVKIKTDKFVVTAASGNTAIAGTLDVDSNTVIKGSLTVGTGGDEFTISESADDITLANNVSGKDIIFNANSSEYLKLNGTDGEIQVSKDIIPASSTVSLGSEGNPFKEIYVSENSIIFGNAGSSQVSKFAVDAGTGQISIQKTDSTGANVDAPLQYVTMNSFATISNLTATGTAVLNQTLRVDGDISANANMSLGGDLSLNGGIQIAGDISWNSANIPADSIPASAIIGGVGSNDFGAAVTMLDTLFVDGDISSNSNFHVGGHIVPRANNVYDIGSAENKIRHLFVSENSLFIGEQNKISVSATGDLQFNKIDKTVVPSGLQGINDIENEVLQSSGKSSLSEVTLADYLEYARGSGETVNGKTGDAITIDDIYTSDASNFASVTTADPTGSDLSLNQTFSVGGHSFFGSDVSFNSGINIAGDISWNSVNIPDNSIPQTAIIGGVGGNTIDGDLNVKTGFIKQF